MARGRRGMAGRRSGRGAETRYIGGSLRCKNDMVSSERLGSLVRFRQLGAERLTQKGQLDRRPRRGIRPFGDLATSLFEDWCAVCEVERCKVRDESREERRVGQRREDDQ